MNIHDFAAYGDEVSGDYDRLYPTSPDSEAAVAALAVLAGQGGSILEFGIGTGRLALSLLARGCDVAGIEGSEAMLAHLRAKPRGDEIEVVVGDFAYQSVGRPFSVVAISFNDIFGLARGDQIACFRNAARHLTRDGCLVIDAYVLRPQQLEGGWTIWPRSVEHEHVELQLSRYDPASRVLERTMVHLRPEGLRFVTVIDHYAWPGELDLMAAAAGLRLRSRDGGWTGEPYDASSLRHVSVYERDPLVGS